MFCQRMWNKLSFIGQLTINRLREIWLESPHFWRSAQTLENHLSTSPLGQTPIKINMLGW